VLRDLPAILRGVLACLPALLAACGSMEREFPGHNRDQVWKAMVETAEDPRYPDWVVVDNEVFRDDASATVEIRRDLRRDVVMVGQKPRREEREWRFTANVTSTEPPSLIFASRSVSIPAHFWLQGQQFMNEVERRLAGMALPPPKTVKPIERPEPDSVEPAQPLVQTARGTEVRKLGSEPAVPADIPEATMRPSRTATPMPARVPAASAAPVPAVEPVEAPKSEPAPEPKSEPAPAPEPAPEPEPAPAPEPEPEPAPEPEPEPAPEPEPEPAPEPEPEPLPPPFEPPPEPSREPAPTPDPAPAPATKPAAEPPYEPLLEPDQPKVSLSNARA
jgi:hypothetical protein